MRPKTIKMTGTAFIVYFTIPSKVATFPGSRIQCLSPGSGKYQHHRPVCGSRRTFRPRVRRAFLANRSFGGAQVSRTFYARGQTGQQLLLGAYSALSRQISTGQVKMHTRSEMLDLVVVDGHAKGIITRNLATGGNEGLDCGCGGALHQRIWKCLLSFNKCNRL